MYNSVRAWPKRKPALQFGVSVHTVSVHIYILPQVPVIHSSFEVRNLTRDKKLRNGCQDKGKGIRALGQ
jgi:hypothetical protein